jgi:diguanylate cyclase (GGDEF)-like protein/PAS domain S-box-containing protein
VLSTGKPIPNFEEQYKDAQGTEHTFLTTKVPLHESTGQVKSVATISVDITDRKHAEEALRESEERFRAIVDNSPSAILLKGMGGRFLIANKQWHNWFNPDNKDIFGKTVFEFFPKKHAEEVAALDRAVVKSGRPIAREMETPFSDGSVRTTILHKFPIFGPDGSPIAIGGLNTDITDRKRAEEALRASERRYRALYEDNPSMYFTVNAEGKVLSVNPFGASQLGYTCEELMGKSFVDLTYLDDQAKVEQMLRESIARPGRLQRREVRKLRKDGALLWARETARASEGADGQKVVLIVCEDSTDAHELSEKLSYQASHDALTGLVNRREFEHRLMRVLQSAQDAKTMHALCYFDLDQFKVINDICGHIAGDELLKQLSQILDAKVRKRDTLARLGGDEFGLLMEHCSLRQAGRVARTLQRVIREFRFVWDNRVFNIGASIGLVPIGSTSESVTSVLSMADAACYAAKDAGRNRIHVYHEEDSELLRRHGEMELVSQINRALEEGRFYLASQPIVSVGHSGSARSYYEILLRMEGQDGGMISPDVFLPAAERYNISAKLDRWVIGTAFAWLTSGAEDLDQLHLCSINLSGHSLGDSEFLQFVVRQFEETRLPAAKICFEITETAAIANLESATMFMKTLKERGCRFALDDFGSGLSSFAYLKNLPVDILKIDGVFVKDIVDDPIALAMVKSINEIGQVMGKKTIAEFVENRNILEKLGELGVDYAQGYGVGRPQPIALTRRRPAAAAHAGGSGRSR